MGRRGPARVRVTVRLDADELEHLQRKAATLPPKASGAANVSECARGQLGNARALDDDQGLIFTHAGVEALEAFRRPHETRADTARRLLAWAVQRHPKGTA